MTESFEDGTTEVDGQLLTRIVRPYKPHCRYLSRAVVGSNGQLDAMGPVPQEGPQAVAQAVGDFAIPESCYIDDTGHLNSVELNICYNQLVYTLFAQCIVEERLPALSHVELSDYLDRHLPDVLIHDFLSVFKKPIDPDRFQGRVSILEAVNTRRFVLFKTRHSFWDEAGGYAKGKCALVFVNRPRMDRPEGAAPARAEAPRSVST